MIELTFIEFTLREFKNGYSGNNGISKILEVSTGDLIGTFEWTFSNKFVLSVTLHCCDSFNLFYISIYDNLLNVSIHSIPSIIYVKVGGNNLENSPILVYKRLLSI